MHEIEAIYQCDQGEQLALLLIHLLQKAVLVSVDKADVYKS